MSRVERRTTTDSDLKLAEFILGADLQIGNSGDVDITSGELNLAQAILHRIRTSKGELAELGHPEYGSSVLDFVGLENNWMTRQRLKLAIRDSLRQEPRIKEIVSITVNPRMTSLTDTKGRKISKNFDTLPSSHFETTGDAESEDLEIDSRFNREGPSSGDTVNTVDIDIVVVPAGAAQPIQMGFPFNLEGI